MERKRISSSKIRRVGYDPRAQVLSRRGFALGAVMAAEWIATRSGVYVFETVLADLLGERG